MSVGPVCRSTESKTDKMTDLILPVIKLILYGISYTYKFVMAFSSFYVP